MAQQQPSFQHVSDAAAIHAHLRTAVEADRIPFILVSARPGTDEVGISWSRQTMAVYLASRIAQQKDDPALCAPPGVLHPLLEPFTMMLDDILSTSQVILGVVSAPRTGDAPWSLFPILRTMALARKTPEGVEQLVTVWLRHLMEAADAGMSDVLLAEGTDEYVKHVRLKAIIWPDHLNRMTSPTLAPAPRTV